MSGLGGKIAGDKKTPGVKGPLQKLYKSQIHMSQSAGPGGFLSMRTKKNQ